MLYIDIGAHVGVYTEKFVNSFDASIVYSFEPNPYNVKILQDKFGQNSKVCIVPYAVGANNGSTKLFRYAGDINDAPQNTGRSSVLSNNRNVSQDNFYEIEMIRLSDFLKHNKITWVDYLKIDVEGSEYDILEDLLDSCLINIFGTIILSEHLFLFYDATFNAHAQQILNRIRHVYRGKLYLEE